MCRKYLMPVLILVLAALACNWPGYEEAPSPTAESETSQESSTPQDAETPEATPTLEESLAEPSGVFTVAILVDITSEPVEREKAQAILRESSQILQERTGFVFELIDFHEMEPGGTMKEMAIAYLETIASETPDGLVIYSFGDYGWAQDYGGYSGWVNGPVGYHNEFVSPLVGDGYVYLAIMHWGHHFGICGYGDGEEVISDVSIGGECRGNPGIPCVEKYDYSMCSAQVDDLYASTPTFFQSAGIVHEFLHAFGLGTSDDHYGTPSCKEIMGWTNENWTFVNAESQYYLNQCPHLFDIFAAGYQP
jgi:hypothetical protein